MKTKVKKFELFASVTFAVCGVGLIASAVLHKHFGLMIIGFLVMRLARQLWQCNAKALRHLTARVKRKILFVFHNLLWPRPAVK